MAIEGPLKELGIHDVFQLLDLSRKTGTLTVTSTLRRNRGTVIFDAGAVVSAEIESNPHPLGRLLVRAGKITEADLRRAQDMQEAGDPRRLGELLVAIGAISQRELERQVRLQIEEVVFELLSWREGFFSFIEGEVQRVPAEASVRIPTEALLMEGARRIDEWSQIERKIPHLGVVPVLAPAVEENSMLDLLPTEWEVLAVVDGQRDIRAVAASLGRSEFEVAKIVFALESAGVLDITDRHPADDETVDADPGGEDFVARARSALDEGDVDAARTFAERARSLDPHDPVVYAVLGRVELAARRPREAEESLRRALRLDPLLAPAHRLLGDALALQGRYAEAVEWWGRWLALDEHGSEGGGEEARRVRDAIGAARTLETLVRARYG